MVTVREAVDDIIKDVSSGEFSLKIELASALYVTPTLIEIRSINSTIYSNSNSDREESNISDGTVAAIALVLLVVGMLIGALFTLGIVLCVACMRSKSSRVSVSAGGMAYKRHQDEVSTAPPVAPSNVHAEPELDNQDAKQD